MTSEHQHHLGVLGLKRHSVLAFLFFVAYTTSTIFYLLRDDVTRSFAISLHRTWFRICPSPVSVHRCVWLPVQPCERLNKHAAATDCLRAPPPRCLIGHTCLGTHQRSHQRLLSVSGRGQTVWSLTTIVSICPLVLWIKDTSIVHIWKIFFVNFYVF